MKLINQKKYINLEPIGLNHLKMLKLFIHYIIHNASVMLYFYPNKVKIKRKKLQVHISYHKLKTSGNQHLPSVTSPKPENASLRDMSSVLNERPNTPQYKNKTSKINPKIVYLVSL